MAARGDHAEAEHCDVLGTRRARLLGAARPFNWKFTAADLTDLLHRIGEHEQAAATRQTDLATAA